MLPEGYYTTQEKIRINTNIIPEGGHVCKIINAFEVITASNSPQLVIHFDITENTQYNNFYSNKYDNDMKRYGTDNTRWKGVFKEFLYTKDHVCSQYFKSLIKAIEKSNDGFVYDGDPKTLIGKNVGFVYRLEPFIDENNKIVNCTRPAWAVATNELSRVSIPKPRPITVKSKQ